MRQIMRELRVLLLTVYVEVITSMLWNWPDTVIPFFKGIAITGQFYNIDVISSA